MLWFNRSSKTSGLKPGARDKGARGKNNKLLFPSPGNTPTMEVIGGGGKPKTKRFGQRNYDRQLIVSGTFSTILVSEHTSHQINIYQTLKKAYTQRTAAVTFNL